MFVLNNAEKLFKMLMGVRKYLGVAGSMYNFISKAPQWRAIFFPQNCYTNKCRGSYRNGFFYSFRTMPKNWSRCSWGGCINIQGWLALCTILSQRHRNGEQSFFHRIVALTNAEDRMGMDLSIRFEQCRKIGQHTHVCV